MTLFFGIRFDIILDVNPSSPSGDNHLFSPHNITTCSNVQVMRTKEMTMTDKML